MLINGIASIGVRLRDRYAHVCLLARGLSIAQSDRAPLGIVCCEQTRSAEAAHQCRELPAESASIADASIHPVAPRRNILVCRITGQNVAPLSIDLRWEQVWGPGIANEHRA